MKVIRALGYLGFLGYLGYLGYLEVLSLQTLLNTFKHVQKPLSKGEKTEVRKRFKFRVYSVATVCRFFGVYRQGS